MIMDFSFSCGGIIPSILDKSDLPMHFCWNIMHKPDSSLNVQVKHVFREGNMVADYLAKHGAAGGSMNFIGEEVSPERLGGLLRTDRLGIPYIRR